MKMIIEEMSGTLVEAFGAVIVFAALSGMVVLFRDFGNEFIGYFLG